MAKTSPTFEDVDKHIEAADLSEFQPGGRQHVAAGTAPAAAIPNICGAYKVIRPILALLLNTPLIPKKWKDAIRVFMGLLDVICP